MARVPRRYLNRTREADLRIAAQVDKSVLHEAFVNSVDAKMPAGKDKEPRPIDHLQHLVYVAAAFVQDMQVANGETVAVYPSDVAGLLGLGEARAGNLLADVKRAGLLEGSAATGYQLVPK